MDIDNINNIKSSKINRKIVYTFIFMFLAEAFPEIFPKHKGYIFISQYFALN